MLPQKPRASSLMAPGVDPHDPEINRLYPGARRLAQNSLERVLQFLNKQIDPNVTDDFGGDGPYFATRTCIRYQTQSQHVVEKLVPSDLDQGPSPPICYVDCCPAPVHPLKFVGSSEREWPDRRLPRRGEPVERIKRGKLVTCNVTFADVPDFRQIFHNDWGISFGKRNMWKSCYGERDRSRPHDPKAKSPGMTSLHVSKALCKAAGLRREVIWESWECDPELEHCDFGLHYPVRWTGKRVVIYLPTFRSQSSYWSRLWRCSLYRRLPLQPFYCFATGSSQVGREGLHSPQQTYANA